jgi:hypothetical protein
MLYAIGLDLADPEENCARIEQWLAGNFGHQVRVLPQLWIAEGSLAAEQIRTGIEPLLGPDDRLVVIKTAREAVTRGLPEAVARWVREAFPDSLTERIP